jgi:hypothetical protein
MSHLGGVLSDIPNPTSLRHHHINGRRIVARHLIRADGFGTEQQLCAERVGEFHLFLFAIQPVLPFAAVLLHVEGRRDGVCGFRERNDNNPTTRVVEDRQISRRIDIRHVLAFGRFVERKTRVGFQVVLRACWPQSVHRFSDAHQSEVQSVLCGIFNFCRFFRLAFALNQRRLEHQSGGIHRRDGFLERGINGLTVHVVIDEIRVSLEFVLFNPLESGAINETHFSIVVTNVIKKNVAVTNAQTNRDLFLHASNSPTMMLYITLT